LEDEDGNVYLDNVGVAVEDENWSYTFIPNIEADEEKTFIVTAIDTIGNESSKTFTISKSDKKVPTITTSSTSTSSDWATSKSITLSATDEGAGNVQIAFNNQDDYALGEEDGDTYSRTYTLIGDVYGETQATTYYKDGLGNETSQFITISNIDNTKPTIEDTQVEINKTSASVTIGANDINTTLNASGSGVVAYALVKEGETLSDDDWQESNTIEVTSSGNYIAYAKDLVGNIGVASSVTTINLNRNYTITTSWDDKDDTLRPDTYTINLYQDGTLIDTKELNNDDLTYTFEDLPTYNEDGNLYEYTHSIEAGDRYVEKESTSDNEGEVTLSCQTTTFSVVIPKNIIIDGTTGEATFEINVDGTLFYNDNVTIVPDESFEMTDALGWKTMVVDITMDDTSFKKDTLGTYQCSLKTTTKEFAGTWTGTFNYNIKLNLQN
jgi:hypothetical protein